MIHHERSLEIDANPERIWAILSRFIQIDEIAPQIAQVEALTYGATGIGSRRRCYFENGTSLVEEVTKWDPNRGYTVRLSEMSAMPLIEAHAAIAIEPLAQTRTRVTWSMDYTVKYGPLGWLMGQSLMKMMMSRVLDGNLKALADKVSSDIIPEAQPAYY
ncbi:SRPBCC family protein [Ruegeria sp. 6PALISEP08]|uniref:SRPBCC family protein n=1 Tax=Ruegeria sp. 6PALISEP08 TaxID=1225660 RepID=UPI00067EE6C6|nr:SRPBCC family protein [Ruegeria sp. 6PALISEP08]